MPSPSSAASRLAVWAAQAQAKVPLAAELSKQDHHKYKFGKEKAAEAAQAIATLREALNRTKKPARGQGKIHVEIIFIDTVPTAKPLAARIHHFYGKHGPIQRSKSSFAKKLMVAHGASRETRSTMLRLQVMRGPNSVKAAQVLIQLRALTGEFKVLGEKGVCLS